VQKKLEEAEALKKQAVDREDYEVKASFSCCLFRCQTPPKLSVFDDVSSFFVSMVSGAKCVRAPMAGSGGVEEAVQ